MSIFKRKFIPKGGYCYQRLDTWWDEIRGFPVTNVKHCDYYEDRGQGEEYCSLMKEDISLFDQCKSCGRHEGVR